MWSFGTRWTLALAWLAACDQELIEPVDEVLSEEAGAPRGQLPLGTPPQEPLAAIPAPLAEAFCEINVEGVPRATETDYLPHVIQCENGGAGFEALKAQAIAARSVAYYAMANDGQICDGQGCQVYSCGADPAQIHYDAVEATAGQYLSYNGWLTYAFFVAGDNQQPASCVDTDNGNVSATEKWVTFNEGKTVYDVDQTALGFKFPEDLNVAGYGQNRGCMSQWGGRCLENTKGYDGEKIVRFYYGADIEILQAQGACVTPPPPPNQPAAGTLEGAPCDAGVTGWAWDPDHPDQPINTYVSFLAPVGDPNAASFTVLANQHRDDLCMSLGSCEHGLSLGIPRSLRDGAPHPVYAVGVDVDAMTQTELSGSPTEFTCPPPALPPGVRRWVTDPGVLDAWKFSTFWQLAKVDAATLATRPEWKPIEAAPSLLQAEGDAAVWLVDLGFRRLVPSPEVAAAWQLDLGAATVVSAAELAGHPEGTPLRPEPFLVQGEGPEVYLIDDPQCPEGGDPNDPQCPPGGGTTGDSGDPSASGAPTEGGSGGGSGGPGGSGGSGGSGGGESEGSAGSGSAGSASGAALPPGFGVDEGCGCRSAEPRGAGLFGLVILAGLARRRRRR